MRRESIIQLVARDDDGDWQFLPYLEEVVESDAMVVGIGEIVALDPSVENTLKLPVGHRAWRADLSSDWHVQ